MTGLRDAALDYASRGWPVFPLARHAKLPMIASAHPEGDPRRGVCRGECGREGHGLHDATTGPDTITSWWSRWPDANIGIRTGITFDVLDIDDDAGLDECSRLFGGDEVELPPGPAVATPSGGLHLWFRPTGLGNRARFRPGLDWRGDGGYVVAPPSTVDGTIYRWWPIDESIDSPLEPAPGWLVALLERAPVSSQLATDDGEASPPRAGSPARGPAYGLAALEAEARAVAVAPEGTRNDRLNRAAHALGRLVADGTLEANIVERVLLAAAVDAGLDDREALATIRSGLHARGVA